MKYSVPDHVVELATDHVFGLGEVEHVEVNVAFDGVCAGLCDEGL